MPGINEDTLERQELYCHACGGYVQFDLDSAINGNHILNCPNCGHEHCRVVFNGRISDERWDSRNPPNALPVYYITATSMTYTAATTANTVSSWFSATTVGTSW